MKWEDELNVVNLLSTRAEGASGAAVLHHQGLGKQSGTFGISKNASCVRGKEELNEKHDMQESDHILELVIFQLNGPV